jgi:hypothetical protein
MLLTSVPDENTITDAKGGQCRNNPLNRCIHQVGGARLLAGGRDSPTSSLILSEPAGAGPELREGRRTNGESNDERAGLLRLGVRLYSTVQETQECQCAYQPRPSPSLRLGIHHPVGGCSTRAPTKNVDRRRPRLRTKKMWHRPGVPNAPLLRVGVEALLPVRLLVD